MSFFYLIGSPPCMIAQALPSDVSPASLLTIIIPTYNRPDCLKGLLRFYAQSNFTIHILDGTDQPASLDIVHLPLIHYHHLPNVNLQDRLLIASNLITTKYSCLLCDDEFHLPSGLLHSVSCLEDNTKASSSIGLCLGFRSFPKDVLGGSFYEYFPYEFPDYLPDRINSYFQAYAPTHPYAVWRSQYLRDSLVFLSSLHPSSGNMWEWTLAFLGLLYGSHIRHSGLHWLRSCDFPPSSIDGLDRSISPCAWFRSSQFEHERSVYLDALLFQIESITKLSIEKCRLLLQLAIAATIYGHDNRSLLQSFRLQPRKNFQRKYTKSLQSILSMYRPPLQSDETNVLYEALSHRHST